MDQQMQNGFFDDMEELYEIPEEPVRPASCALHREAARALACCINENGCVNLPWMAESSGLSVPELTEALEGAIFQDPEGYDQNLQEDQDWVLRPGYVSGNIMTKLAAAKKLNRKYGGRFDANVRALKESLPAMVRFRDIGVGIGSSWIPESCYALFAKQILGLSAMPEIHRCKRLGQWKVETPDSARSAIHNVYTFGTKRMSALKILEHTLNASTVKIYDEADRPDCKSGKARVLNKNETLAAQEKQEALQQAFQEWIGKDPGRVKRLEKIYYEKYACLVAGRYDGSFLTLPDLNPEFVPYPHQKDAVARIILEKDVILNHAVGSGKTGCLIMGIHERKRMGLSEKNLVVVPNHVLEAFERTHRFLYPEDKILVISPADFRPALRQEALEKIRDGDYTAVYMAFSSFDRIPMSRRYRLEIRKEEIRSMKAAAASAGARWERQLMEACAARMGEALEKLEEKLPEDSYLSFDELGITTLAVDEAHHFKNITLRTKADGVVGMHGSGSAKCDTLLEKSRYVRSQGGSLLFSTGTPLTNSISDLFALQSYLQPEQLELLQLSHFDEWIGSFAMRQSSFEVDVDSQNFRIMTRFSRFYNLPELTALFSNVCDFYNGTESGAGLPECSGYIDTVVPRSQEQEAYIEELVLRTEMVRARLVKGAEDNLLKITQDGRAAALDIRLTEPAKEPDPQGTKAYACARNVFACWKEHPDTAQLVFCDTGTPKKAFNLYDELKKLLIEMGIPENQIAFVHDANTEARRRRLFDSVNKARVRVLIGSTSKLGTGVNVQERLIAIHHLDVPWKPSDMIQREGRLIRQGNRNERVFRYRYITAGTFDAYSWQIVENKQRFIGQFMKGALAERDVRDLDDAVLSYAEIKALSVGDPLMKTRIETANALERVRIHSRRRAQELKKLEHIAAAAPDRIERLTARRQRLLCDRDHFAENRESLSKQEREAFGEELLQALAENAGKKEERCFDWLHGFRILLPAGMLPEKPCAVAEGVSGNRYEADMREAKAAGCIQRIEYLLMHLADRVRMAEADLESAEEKCRQAKEELEKGNRYEKEEARLREALLDIDQELNRRAEEGAA